MNEDIISICGCGKPLIAVHDGNGKRIGVSHATVEDEEYHSQYFAGLLMIQAPKSESLN